MCRDISVKTTTEGLRWIPKNTVEAQITVTLGEFEMSSVTVKCMKWSS